MTYEKDDKSLGIICAGIGGWDLGFEQAGWRARWQIELDDVNRYCLADRFPESDQFKNLNDWRAHRLPRVRCIAFSSPCQDISIMGNARVHKERQGLAGERSGLFFECMEIVGALEPEFVVFENVVNLLHCNDSRDLQSVCGAFTERNYWWSGRVLDSAAFGIPQKRRRFLLVARLGQPAPAEFLADAGPMESLPCAGGSSWVARFADAWAGYTLTAPDKLRRANSRSNLGSELFVAEEDGWHQMAERSRAAEVHGFPRGMDAANTEEAYAAGNAMPPPMAKWVAEILNRAL